MSIFSPTHESISCLALGPATARHPTPETSHPPQRMSMEDHRRPRRSPRVGGPLLEEGLPAVGSAGGREVSHQTARPSSCLPPPSCFSKQGRHSAVEASKPGVESKSFRAEATGAQVGPPPPAGCGNGWRGGEPAVCGAAWLGREQGMASSTHRASLDMSEQRAGECDRWS